MRNQLLRDTDWSSMAHGLEVRVPFVDATCLIGSDQPSRPPVRPISTTLLVCARLLPTAMLERPKTGFTTPVQALDCRCSRPLDARAPWMGDSVHQVVSWAFATELCGRLAAE